MDEKTKIVLFYFVTICIATIYIAISFLGYYSEVNGNGILEGNELVWLIMLIVSGFLWIVCFILMILSADSHITRETKQ